MYEPDFRFADTFFNLDSCISLCASVINSVPRDSSPGYPLSAFYATSGEAIEMEEQLILQVSGARLYLMMLLDIIDIQDADRFMTLRLRDPVSTFIKEEPHPKRKAELRKWRTICAISLGDQIVERAMFMHFVDNIKARYPDLSSAIGIGFTDEQIGEFADKVVSRIPKDHILYSSDISGFESCISITMLYLVTVCVFLCIPGIYHSRLNAYRRTMDLWVSFTAQPIYYFNDGTLYQQLEQGLMPSGRFMTTGGNTLMRLLLAAIVKSKAPTAAGDDCLEALSDALKTKESYEKLGLNMRDYKTHGNESFEFCSHRYFKDKGQWKAELLSWPKAFYKLVTKTSGLEQWASVWHEIRHNSDEVKTKFIELQKEFMDLSFETQ
jgi:hypothetical protein